MKGFVKRLWSRRWVRGCVWTLVTILTLLILVRQYIGWSGARRWAAVQQMLSREGETLDIRAIASEPVPDDQNFCTIPLLKDAPFDYDFGAGRDGESAKRRKLVLVGQVIGVAGSGDHSLPFLPGARLGAPTDLGAWAQRLREQGQIPVPNTDEPAPDLFAALSADQPIIGELAAGLRRPESQWTPTWRTLDLPEPLYTIRIPQYGVGLKLVAMLSLRSAAAARSGDAANAHQSLLIATRLNQANLDGPFIIAPVSAAANSAAICGALWELCDSHSGTEDQFHLLQQQLARLDYRRSWLQAARGELAAAANDVQWMKRREDRKARNIVIEMSAMAPRWGLIALLLQPHVMPGGWFDANMAVIAQRQLEYCIKPLRDGGFRDCLAGVARLDEVLAQSARHPWCHSDQLLAAALEGNYHMALCRAVYAQALVNEAIAACALERYRIEHGAYPDTLDAANHPGEPAIPLDPISGKSMGYRKTPDGRYALWSVGFDGVDHGGVRVLDKDRPEHTKFYDPHYSGDWVWDFTSS